MTSAQRTIIAGVLLAPAIVTYGQTEQPKVSFEIASIRAAAPYTVEDIRSGKAHIGLAIDQARVDIGSVSLSTLVMLAWKLKSPKQISGPPWLGDQKFDILAKMPEGASRDQAPQMLRSLLEDRFKMFAHVESKPQAVYALIAGKTTPNIQAQPPNTVPSLKPSLNNGLVRMEFVNTMAAFADFLTPYLDRLVVDMTDLPGIQHLVLEVARPEAAPRPDDNSAAAALPQSPVSPFFSAVESLGLKLEPRNMPIETVIVEKSEKTPTDN